MAKRKRLTPANPAYLPSAEAGETLPEGLETKSLPPYRDGWSGEGPQAGAAPIARIAGDTAASAALADLADRVARDRAAGRLVLELPREVIATGYLVRDRSHIDAAEMQALKDSLRARGQQTPIEVAELQPGRYGLISGWRRMQALAALRAETGDARFDTVLALLRRPAEAAEAYQAMVEENEVRVGLSYYERARIVARAADQGVFPSEKEALKRLFATASAPRRSKIGAFLGIVRALDGHLRFPEALSERQGLQLAHGLADRPALAGRLALALTAAQPKTAEAEIALIQRFLAAPDAGTDPGPETPGPETAVRRIAESRAGAARPPAPPRSKPAAAAPVEPLPGLRVQSRSDGGLLLSGAALTPDLVQRLLDWLAAQGAGHE
ncbi:ParB/RepB/Spo0J family partition protein [Frigidibacter sp. ROC022]|uniref:ParB/RepB/Spo0J family partition protein n=1 Tax=Frigidibacter sp. ROC022 TaxID=2971796 RepID=UPI00215AE90D|nr:ParB N-terminal domain-containing protein [Frigidibacter sp. ROC022]MCR8726819.1 ParB N-terminal domain-containing protein [Frigidibacter sp. ROC022]